MKDSFQTFASLDVDGETYQICSLKQFSKRTKINQLLFSIKILLENLLRNEDGQNVTEQNIQALAAWSKGGGPDSQVAFTPARVILQDFTGVPAIVDLAAMRDAMSDLGKNPNAINPLVPVDMVIDHSVMVDHYGSDKALDLNTQIEFKRNKERYQFLRWGQQAFSNFRVVPPGTGIVHQVNLEYLGHVVMTRDSDQGRQAYPDTLVGTDSHTTMINGLGILGWGVGGIEAEAAMLGQPVTMLMPEVVGFKFEGKLTEGATATDLVLTVTQMLRKKGVVGKFVEFYGDGLDHLPLADRATIANMAPEYGATCGIFPIDKETIRYLQLSGRDEHSIKLVEAYARHQGLWRDTGDQEAVYSDNLQLDLGTVVPSIAGPKRPQDRISLDHSKSKFLDFLQGYLEAQGNIPADQETQDFEAEGGQTAVGAHNWHETGAVEFRLNGETHRLKHGDVVIAAITSCTNTSNPDVMIAAGLLAKRAREQGLKVKPWVKTSLAPGSQVVPSYLKNAGVSDALDALGFNVVRFGCTTCIGNSGPLPEPVQEAIRQGSLCVSSVLSGNRNFEGRIHPDVRTNYLASPPLVVAYALAGSMAVDLFKEPLGKNNKGEPVFLKDIWPSQQEVAGLVQKAVSSGLFSEKYADVFKGSVSWQSLSIPEGAKYTWPDSTYVKNPPFFAGMSQEPDVLQAIEGARCLVKVGHSITTDHISPAGSIHPESPAGLYLHEQGIQTEDFNSYGSRRGNHEVMMRGTFANVRLKNQLAPGTEGGWTLYHPTNVEASIYDAAMRYQEGGTPLIVLAGKEYGTGSSRDWAAKGTSLLGIRAVIAESYERIHRSNLVGFGVVPLQFLDGDSVESLGLKGDEFFSISSLNDQPSTVKVKTETASGESTEFEVLVRIDTATEWQYFRHGGILHFVLRNLT